MSKETKLDVAIRNATETTFAKWRVPPAYHGVVYSAVRAGAKAAISCADAIPHSEHKGWDSLFADVAAVRDAAWDAQCRPLAAKEKL